MSGEDIRFEVVRTKGDYAWGLLINTARSPRAWISYGLGSLVVAIMAYMFIDADEPSSRVAIAAGAFGVMLLFYALIVLVSVALAAMKSWRAPGAFTPIQFGLSPAGISVSHETGSSETKWVVWKSYFETAALFVIRHRMGFIQILPKRTMSTETIERVRALLNSCLRPPPAKGAAT